MNEQGIAAAPELHFDTPALKRYGNRRRLKDKAARWGIATGGIGIIVAILLIFIYLLYEVAPLFRSAEMQREASYMLPVAPSKQASEVLYLTMEEQAEQGLRVMADGQAVFFDTRSGNQTRAFNLPLPEGVTISSIGTADPASHLMVAGLSNGDAIVFKHDYRITWPNDQRVITPAIVYPYGETPITLAESGKPVTEAAIHDSDEQLLLVGSSGQRLFMKAFTKEEDFLTEEITLEEQRVDLPAVAGEVKKLLIDTDQQWLYVVNGNDSLSLFSIRNIHQPELMDTIDLTEGTATVTAAEFLLGGISLLIGDSQGHISQWFLVRDAEGKQQLTRIRDFQLGDHPVTSIASEHRRKGFLAVDATGTAGLFNTTSSRTLLTLPVADTAINTLGMSPRGNALLMLSPSGIEFWRVENEHPEVSWSALWEKVWYESYEQPEYIWQSSASNNDFEPKLSLMPLAFGTLKAAFYAMLLAAPLAICGAIYTAYFMAPGLRRKVKPVIELMEALPTVILGFLAGLWLAPFVENNLAGIFALLLIVPFAVLGFAFCWDRLPIELRSRVPDGWQPLILVPVILLAGWAALGASGTLEHLFFGGDMRAWITKDLGIAYDQRNAMVVGLAMGFAVIPTIFSIAEDAIFSVPKHLTYGSLALGATPWQTLTRVVLLTASPGIFSALMIGMGRAVGETMIVLMATGNTPIMDANIFEGMRTLAANIAVEMPESEVGSSHFRILFLAALTLFLFTFLVNTMAELVRHRLRTKYSSL
ncbi:ABC transporter permease subunit [Kistimonas asteriae]|nr:ABC transporter permease subunit [Kistimonas asteriae]